MLAEFLKKNTTVEELQLDGNSISDVGADKLVEALKINTVTTKRRVASANIVGERADRSSSSSSSSFFLCLDYRNARSR